MTAAELSALSDQQLSERVAVEVAGFQTGWSGTGMSMNHDGWRALVGVEWRFYYFHELPSFATSADAVWPLLEKEKSWGIDVDPHVPPSNRYRVMLRKYGIAAEGPTVARTICVALLLAKGAA